jgi:putative ABC transport system permease protein
MFAVAAGVGSLTGVRGFSEAFRGMLSSKARNLMAADVSSRDFALPTPQQQAVLDSLATKGARLTRITETLTMMSSPAQAFPLMVSAKAVDPKAYPFYGTVKLRPEVPLASVLNDQTVAVADDVLIRLKASIGDTVRLGGQDFRIAAVVVSEPDRMAGSLNLGLRVMMTRGGLDRTGLIRMGSRAAQRTLFKLPAQGLSVASVKLQLQKAFPEAQVIDFRETNPTITRGLERATIFLSLICLIALIVGALGVASAMHAHLQQKMDSIAVMKSLGARSSQVIRVYTIEALMLGLGGAVLGIAAGLGIQIAFPHLLQRYFQMKIDFQWNWLPILQGLSAGLLTTLLFTVPPLLRIRLIRPSVILRREMSAERKSWKKRWTESWPALIAAVVILAAMGGVASWLAQSPRVGIYFAGGLVVSLFLLSAVAWLLLRALRIFLRTTSLRLPSALRHGLANLYRPGNQAQPVLVALGVGVMFTLSVYLVQNSLLADIIGSAPPNMPNVFLIDIQPQQRDGVVKLVESQMPPSSKLDIVPSVQARLILVNGVPVEQLRLDGFARRFLRTRAITASDARPDGVQILKGKWWSAGDASPLAAITEETAKILKIAPGSQLEFSALDRKIDVRVATVFRSESFRMGGMSEFTLTPATIKGLPGIFYAGVHLKPENVPVLQRIVYQQYPTVTVINIAEALALIQEVVDQIALVIRFLSAFAILAGVIILASSIAGTRFRRVREVVILKTLGGTRSRIAQIFSVEFLLLGLVAGLMGSLLAAGFSTLLLSRLLEGEGHISWLPVLVGALATAFIANATGWLASFRILGQKPLEVLREE